MGGSSSSSSTRKTVNQSWDYSTHIVQTDHGAVEAGKDISIKALDAMGKSTSEVLQFGTDQAHTAASVTLDAIDLARATSDKPLAALAFMERTADNAMATVANSVKPATQSTQEELIKWGAMTAIALGIAQVIKK